MTKSSVVIIPNITQKIKGKLINPAPVIEATKTPGVLHKVTIRKKYLKRILVNPTINERASSGRKGRR